jgi:hypothetical protein
LYVLPLRGQGRSEESEVEEVFFHGLRLRVFFFRLISP